MSISQRKRYQVLERDGFRCKYCGITSADAYLVMDHVIPRKHGGRNYNSNLVAACEPCNGGKWDELPSAEFVERVIADQTTYEMETSSRAQCERCGNLAYFTLSETGQRVCGICYAGFRAGLAYARERVA